jgi:glucose/arabinose dehydrogenase
MRLMRRHAVALLLGFASAIACTEKLPRALDQSGSSDAGTHGPEAGLDTRPASDTCLAGNRPDVAPTLIAYEKVTKATFTTPTDIVSHDGRLYILEQEGKILRLDDDGATPDTVLDITERTLSGGEAGLLGLAFHPKFADNGYAYVFHSVPYPTQPPPDGVVFQSAIERYTSHNGGLTLDLATEKRILTIDKPYSNHNGGTLAFGRDGYLYFGTGDGGAGGDPGNRAQNKTVLLGKMLRLDVDGGDPYGIPPDNPFAGGGGRPEIFALGLRNPYRFSFDDVTGDLWVGDVGQGAREEIDKVVLGGNYGWNIREGKLCYPPPTPTCDTTGLIDPVVDHGRDEATTIIGGVVYRGTGIPLLSGKYVYADFNQSTFWTIPIDQASPTPFRLDVGLPRVNPTAFAIDKNGEIVFTDYGGTVYRVVAPDSVPAVPTLLSQTGCVDPNDPTKPTAGLFPYDVNVPAWDDGAVAQRWLSVPDGRVLSTSPNGRFVLPPGSIAMKTLSDASDPRSLRRIQTQLLLERPDRTWDAYSYLWNDAQTEATLTQGSATVQLPNGRAYPIVDENGCFACHSIDASATLGLEAAQLDRDGVDFGGGRLGNPLATLTALEMLASPVPKTTYTPLPAASDLATTEQHARAYLHVNCGNCHRGGAAELDLRFFTPFARMNACNQRGASGPTSAVRLVPGSPDASEIVRAMKATDGERMPPVGTSVPDTAGIAAVSSWIGSLATCP